MGRGVILALFAVASAQAAGCNSAQYVVKQQDGGVVAIPANNNVWPFHYRDEALTLIRQHVGSNYEIVDERSVVTGTTTTNNEQTNREQVYNKKNPNLPGERDYTTGTVTSNQNTQWQITYRRKFGPVVNDQPSGGNPPAISASVVPSIQPPGVGAALTGPMPAPGSHMMPAGGAMPMGPAVPGQPVWQQ
jgi:hypothetical protein